MSLGQVQQQNTNVELFKTPVSALRPTTRKLLSNLLNHQKLLQTDNGDFRDYRGLAIRLGLDKLHGVVIKNNSLESILHVWEKRSLEEANLERFQQILGLIDRWDVIDDTNTMFCEDARIYHTGLHQPENKTLPLELVVEHDIRNTDDVYECLTNDDLISVKYGLPLIIYDSFVLYVPEDRDFAKNMIKKLGLMNFKICSKDDLLPIFEFKYEAIIHLITKRCNRMIVIVSPAFLRSHVNKFFLSYTKSLGIKQGYNKIIPCVYEHFQLPDMLQFYVVLNFLHSGPLYNFWDRLRAALEYAAINLTNSRPRQAVQAVPNHRFKASTSDIHEIEQKIVTEFPIKTLASVNSQKSGLNLSKIPLNLNDDGTPIDDNRPKAFQEIINTDLGTIETPSSTIIRTNWFKRIIN